MIIERLKLENWRNYRHGEAHFDRGVNIIYGANAQGKTNLLEAVFYLGTASSFRTSDDLDLINKDSDYFYLEAEASSQRVGRLLISAAMNRDKKRKWLINGTPRRRLADIVGIFHTVIFSPEDINLVKGGPACRRRWLNRQISQLDPLYCHALLRYNQVLRQRNACLKNWQQQPDADALAVWNEQLILLGSEICCRRGLIIEQLNAIAAPLHGGLSAGEQLQLRYRCDICGRAPFSADSEQLADSFARELQRRHQAELLRGATLCGPQHDDVEILLGGDAARDFASQGQQRMLALSLKLAELELAYAEKGEYPVLLLDDVLSELDANRSRRVLQLPEKTQTFISAALLPELIQPGRLWLVSAPQGAAQLQSRERI